MTSNEPIKIFAIPKMPFIQPGNDIGNIIIERMEELGGLQNRDILVIASKAVSYTENCIVDLAQIKPSPLAIKLSQQLGRRKPPELMELILSETKPGKYKTVPEHQVIICWHKFGFYITSAGVDKLDTENKQAMVLPKNPDKSAKNIMQEIKQRCNQNVSIVLSDSEGRPDRLGAGAICIGCAGIDPLRTHVSKDGKKMEETQVDYLANAGSLLLGQRDQGVPVVIIRGYKYKFNPKAKLSTAIHKE
jgi:coenzyme F420-0:L-glutamate ligase/coenzyme F420-1:gamma-L-glutamate ligase